MYRADRVLDAVVLEHPAHRPNGFELAAFWQEWSADFESSRQRLTVTLKIDPKLWDTLPEVFGEAVIPRMRAAPPAQGGWRQIELTFESKPAARTRILGLGPQAEVVEPMEIRQEILRAANETVRRYTG